MTANPLTPSTQVIAVQAPASAQGTRFTPLDPIRVLRQYWKELVFFLLVSFIVGLGLFYFLRFKSPEYTTEAQIFVSGALINAYAPSVAGSPKQQRLDVLGAFIKNQIVRIKSDDVISAAFQQAEMQKTSLYQQFKRNPSAAKDQLVENLSVSQIVGSTLIQLKLTGSKPVELPVILDAVLTANENIYRDVADKSSAAFRATFKAQRDKAEDEYNAILLRLAEFRNDEDLTSLEAANNEASLTYNQLAKQASIIAVRLETSREILRSLQYAQKQGVLLASSPDALAKVEADTAIASRDERIRSMREQIDVFRHRFGPGHRAVMELEHQIAAIKTERKLELDRLLRERQLVAMDQAEKGVAAFEGQLSGMQPALTNAADKLRALTNTLSEYHQIASQAKSVVLRRDKAQKVLDDTEVRNKRPDSSGIETRLHATAPRMTFPTMPGIILTVMFLVEALVLVIVFVKELLDQRIKSPSDVMLIPHAKVLGVLPHAADEDPLSPKDMQNIVHVDPTGLVAESFRQVRTAILGATQSSGLRVFMLVGPQPDSGASSVVNNLALSMAHDNRKVLVIDANFRKPDQHRLFGTVGRLGLSDVLTGHTTLEDAVAQLVDPAVDVLTAGAAASAAPELFESRTFIQLLEDCRSRYDVVLIDAPPALLTSEAQILSKYVDAIAVVVRAVRDQRGMVARMLRMLDGSNAVVLGIILNAVRANSGGYFRENYTAFRKYRQGGSRDIVQDQYQDDVVLVDEPKPTESKFDSLRDDDDDDSDLGLPK